LENVKNILSDVCDLHRKTVRRESSVISLMKTLHGLCSCCCLCVWICVRSRMNPLQTDILKVISHSCSWNLLSQGRLCMRCDTNVVLGVEENVTITRSESCQNCKYPVQNKVCQVIIATTTQCTIMWFMAVQLSLTTPQ
jgi:hypothetical protein